MNLSFDGQNFPRKLSEIEKYWINKILPDTSPVYKSYRERIESLFVIGYGKYPPFNLILGEKNDTPELDVHGQPLIATGSFFYKHGRVNVSIFEEFENQIEIDIQSDGFYYYEVISDELKGKEIRWFTYSNWSPGQNHPDDNSKIRLTEIEKDKIVLAISPSHKRIWIYDYSQKLNKFIPITNFYQELLKVLKIQDVKTLTDINYFYLNLNKFTDKQLKDAFLNYNRIWKKISISITLEESGVKENKLFKFFKRLKWKK